MRRSLFMLLLAGVLFACGGTREKQERLALVKDYVMDQVGSLQVQLDSLVANVDNRQYDRAKVQFERARHTYKHIEPIIDFYFAGAGKAINGPAIDKADEHDDKVNYATGFQVAEEFLYPNVDTVRVEELKHEVAVLQSCGVRIHALMKGTELTDQNIFQAVRLHVLRIMSLGITGFDSPVALLSIPECGAALSGMQQLMMPFASDDSPSWGRTLSILMRAQQYLGSHDNFDSFDRATFIRRFLNPLSRSIFSFQNELGIDDNKWKEALDMRKQDFFEPNVYQAGFFTNERQIASAQLVALGKMLFFDPALSGNNKRACASCHRPELAFTDGKVRSVAFDFEGSVDRNAPTLINAAFQRSQFWDQRVMFVEDQITDVLSNRHEMHNSLDKASELLNASKEYQEAFKSAFNDALRKDIGNEPITPKMIGSALAAYVQSLSSFESRFDKYMRDSTALLSKEEINGFNLFMGKAKCATCHFMPLFNGSVPPMYAETESEVLGVPSSPDTVNATVDGDPGKYSTYPRELFKSAFKTPTVRNIALTAPYMHNGVYNSLEDVLDFYNRGGGKGIGIQLDNQTLPSDKLNLSIAEQRDIIKFLYTLTDTTALTSKPTHLPMLSDDQLNKRKIGGEY
ncbi:cytochrome c peroxidase [Chryseolinea sp. T2]|uniref:cytochrome c peroxidase n=1 Tax=Chryseolinea sp. T2 TaxID=3129255 RepID=UPI0030785B08